MVDTTMVASTNAGETRILETGTGILSGTLTVPAGAGPVPLVLIIAGSGPTDRNGNSPLLPGKNNSVKMLAEGLTSWGVAAVPYDDRGIGASSKAGTDESSVTIDTFIDDAVAWKKYKQDSRFSDFGIIGHSEGSLIGMLASQPFGSAPFIMCAIVRDTPSLFHIIFTLESGEGEVRYYLRSGAIFLHRRNRSLSPL